MRSNPNHVRESRFVIEYEFSVAGDRPGDPRTHEGGRRVFRANYDTRGAYAPETVDPDGLTWGGRPLIWGGDDLTWGDDD